MGRKFVCKFEDYSFEAAVCEALGINPTMASRVIIDLQAGHAAVVYITLFADAKIHDVQFNGVDFIIIEKEGEDAESNETS